MNQLKMKLAQMSYVKNCFCSNKRGKTNLFDYGAGWPVQANLGDKRAIRLRSKYDGQSIHKLQNETQSIF